MIETRVERQTILDVAGLTVLATVSADVDPAVDWVRLTVTRARGSIVDGPVRHEMRLGDIEDFVAALRAEAKLNRGRS